jgi:hypothetical protein
MTSSKGNLYKILANVAFPYVCLSTYFTEQIPNFKNERSSSAIVDKT